MKQMLKFAATFVVGSAVGYGLKAAVDWYQSTKIVSIDPAEVADETEEKK